jgi:hypothetical protein
VTLGHMRSQGCRDLLVYCNSDRCNHSTIMNVGHLPEDTPIKSLGYGIVCTQCGHLGADVVPNWPTTCRAVLILIIREESSAHDAAAQQAIFELSKLNRRQPASSDRAQCDLHSHACVSKACGQPGSADTGLLPPRALVGTRAFRSRARGISSVISELD